jgi:hypothetical protein
MIGQRGHLAPGAAVVVADEQRARIDAGIQPARLARVGLDEPDAFDHVVASFGEADRAGRIAPRLAAIGGELERGAPPRALAGDRQAAAAKVRNMIDFTALQERALERPHTSGRIGFGNEGTLSRTDE